MPQKTWYAIMLFMPLLAPVACYLLTWQYGYEVLDTYHVITRFIIVCAIISGLPYLFFSIALFLYWKKKSLDEIRKSSWWLPWVFTPICGLFFYIAFKILYPTGDAGQSALIMVIFCVPVAFLYVIAVHILTHFAIRFKLIAQ